MPQPSSSSRHAVTAPSSSRLLARKDRVGMKSGVVARVRGTVGSVTDVETELLTLTPDLLGALRDLKPKKPRSKVGYVLALAIVAVLGVLAADTSTREFGITRGRAIAARLHRTPAAPAPEPVNAPVVTTAAQVASAPSPSPPEQVAAPVVNVAAPNASAPPNASASGTAKKGTKTTPAAPSRKLQPRSAVRSSLATRTATLASKPSARDI